MLVPPGAFGSVVGNAGYVGSDAYLGTVRTTVADDALLKSLRDHMLDEAEPLAGLVRKCLLLGAEPGSESLRQWACKELNGYDEGDSPPRYRTLPTRPIIADTMSGNSWATNMSSSRIQLPAKARAAIGDALPLYQPIEEPEKVAVQKSVSFTGPGLVYARHAWYRELPPFQEVVNLRFRVPGPLFAGPLGQIRTQLVDLVADLTAGTPLTQLPRKELVDAAVATRIGTQYNTTIHAPSGPTATGDSTKAKSEGLSVDEVVKLLEPVRDASEDVSDEDTKSELLEAIEVRQAEAQAATRDTGAVVKKAGRPTAAAAKAGGAGLIAGVRGVTQLLTAPVTAGALG